MIQALPDLAPFAKLGTVGILLFIIVLGLVVGLKVATLLLKQMDSKKPPGMAERGHSVEFWELTNARIAKEAMMPIVEVLMRIEKNQTEMNRVLRNVRLYQKHQISDDTDSDE